MTDLRVDDLVVEYGGPGHAVRPLDGFGMAAQSGELVLLLGPSGCGKTTLLSCLAGLLTPTSGTIAIGGEPLLDRSGAELTAYRRTTIGIVFQAFNLVPAVSALENVAAPLWGAGWKRRPALDRARELLDLVGLSTRTGHRPGELSGGQQQRVAIARALALDPPLLLADEPTAHLDHVQVEGILQLVRSLATPGRLVVVATHDDRLTPLADRLVSLVPEVGAAGGPEIERRLEPGEVLFRQGQPSDRIYVVESGEIEIVRASDDGETTVLATVGADSHFGEMGPLFDLPRSATATARTATSVRGYTVRAYRDLTGAQRLADLIPSRSVPTAGPAGPDRARRRRTIRPVSRADAELGEG